MRGSASIPSDLLATVPVVVVSFFLYGAEAQASCVSSLSTTGQAGDLILVTGISTSMIDTATSYWTICGNYGSGFPAFTSDTSASGDATIGVQYHQGQTNSHCGSYDPNTQTVHLYDKGLTSQGNEYRCNQADTLAHELGHALGLANSGCQGYLMGPPPLFEQNGELQADSRSVQSGECNEADKNWLTDQELGELDPKDDETCAK